MLPLELRPLGLAAIRAATLLLLSLITGHAGTQLDINPWRSIETKALGDLHQVQLVHIEHGAKRMRGVRLEVRSVSFLGRLWREVSTGDLQCGADMLTLLR